MTDDEGYRGIMLFGMAILVLKLAIVPELVGFFHTVSAFFGNTPAPVVELVKCLVIPEEGMTGDQRTLVESLTKAGGKP